MEDEIPSDFPSRMQSRWPRRRTTPATKSPVRKLLADLFSRWHRNRTIGVLQSLDDRVLRDIGMTRGEIPYVASWLTQNRQNLQAPARPEDVERAPSRPAADAPASAARQTEGSRAKRPKLDQPASVL